MAVVFLFIGIAAIAIGVRGQASAAGQLLASEFTGKGSYIEWLAPIAILGTIGFYRPARPAANAMLGLVILAMFINKGQGFFDQINQALTNAQPAPKPPSSVNAGNAAQSPAATAGSDIAKAIQLPTPPGPSNPLPSWEDFGIGGFASDLMNFGTLQ